TFVEAIGPRPPTPSQVDAAQQRLAAALNQPVTLEVTFRSDVIVNNRGYHASEAAGERHQGTRANTSQ
ncbi:MAG: hypothetical protein GY859_23560, partial [Desulfobacterales bacterium]|nr:hypothetical protein [Desulfobacterales bacterium]